MNSVNKALVLSFAFVVSHQAYSAEIRKNASLGQFFDLLFHAVPLTHKPLREHALQFGVSDRSAVEKYSSRFAQPAKIDKGANYPDGRHYTYLTAFYPGYFVESNYYVGKGKWRNKLYTIRFRVEYTTTNADKERDLKRHSDRLYRALTGLFGKPVTRKFRYSSRKYSTLDIHVWKTGQYVIQYRASSGNGLKKDEPYKVYLNLQYWSRAFFESHDYLLYR